MPKIEVGYKPEFRDAIGESVKSDIIEDLGISGIQHIFYVDVYDIKADLSAHEIEHAAKELFCDKVAQFFSIDKPLFSDADWELTVQYRPGVTDNVGIAATEGLEDLLGKKFENGGVVRSARKFYLRGNLSEHDIKRICMGLLANQQVETFSYRRCKND